MHDILAMKVNYFSSSWFYLLHVHIRFSTDLVQIQIRYLRMNHSLDHTDRELFSQEQQYHLSATTQAVGAGHA